MAIIIQVWAKSESESVLHENMSTQQYFRIALIGRREPEALFVPPASKKSSLYNLIHYNLYSKIPCQRRIHGNFDFNFIN